jgi:hypothetical protein
MSVETESDFPAGQSGRVARWIDELAEAEKWLGQEWWERAERVERRYIDEQYAEGVELGARFNVLWPNTEILRAAIYGQRPRPDVRRRGDKRDPVGRQGAMVIERGLEYQWDTQSPHVDCEVDALLTDHMLAGAGLLRVRYKPQWARRRAPVMRQDGDDGRALFFGPELEEIDAEDVIEDGDDLYAEIEELQFERADVEHVHYRDYLFSPSKSARDLRWMAFRHYFTHDELVAAFGPAKAARCNLTVNDTTTATSRGSALDETPSFFAQALVWEIWDKSKRRVYFLSPGLEGEFLGDYDDAYQLRDFFPTPGLWRSINRTDSMLPTPEYVLYQDQAAELDDITARISGLIEQIKVAGFYDAQLEELPDVMKATNALIPITNWAALVERGGIDGAISWVPIEQAIKALTVLYEQRRVILDTIYQIIGLSDIVRGASDARETATAQQIKSQYGGLRLQPRQRALQGYLRDVMRIQAELIAEKFEPTTLMQMTGLELDDQVLMLLRMDSLRQFAIDVETDSTIAIDDQADKQQTIEFFGAMTQFAQGAAAAVQTGMIAPEAARALMLYGARRFKAGREVEDALELEGQPQPQQEQPDPVAMAKLEVDKANAETKRMSEAAKDEREREKLDIERTKLGLDERQLEADAMIRVLQQAGRGGGDA